MSVTFPTTAKFRTMNWQSNDNIIASVTTTNKVFTKDLGGQYWSFTLQSVPLTRDDFMPIWSFLTQRRGGFESFRLVPPVIGSSRGTFSNPGDSTGTNLTTSSASVGDTAIGVTPAAPGTLKSGDLIKFSNHNKVYILTQDVTLIDSVANTLNIFPNLRTALDVSDYVITEDVALTVRQKSPTQQFNTGIDGVFQYEIDVAETVD